MLKFERPHHWVLLGMLLGIAHCQERWVHYCLSEERAVVCEKGAIFELTGIYSAYRELGCPSDSTDPVSDIADCSEIYRYEKILTKTIVTACNQTSTCNITSVSGDEAIGSCTEPTNVISNFISYSYICKPGPSTAAPSTTKGTFTATQISHTPSTPKGTFTATQMSHTSQQKPQTTTYREEVQATDKLPGYTGVDIAAVSIGILLLGLVLGATIMLCITVHRGVPESIVNCVKCRYRRKDGSSQSNGLQRHTNEEGRTDYYNVNSSDQDRVPSTSGLSTANPSQTVNGQDMNLDDVRVYSELQSSDYVNGPDSTVYEGLTPQRL